MKTSLPVELFSVSRASGPGPTEEICTQAMQRGDNHDVVAVSVTPADVARAAHLLFGTGVGVVSTIDDQGTGWIDQVRHSVASGATEIALPSRVLQDPGTLTRLRSRLGPITPLTVELSEPHQGPGLGAAADILRLGADFLSFAPAVFSPASLRDLLDLIVESGLDGSGVKIPVITSHHQMLLSSASLHELADQGVARLRLPVLPQTQ